MSRQISVRLPDDLVRILDARAKRENVVRSQLIRMILEAALDEDPSAMDRPYERVKDLIGALSGGPTDLGARHRDYLLDLSRAR